MKRMARFGIFYRRDDPGHRLGFHDLDTGFNIGNRRDVGEGEFFETRRDETAQSARRSDHHAFQIRVLKTIRQTPSPYADALLLKTRESVLRSISRFTGFTIQAETPSFLPSSITFCCEKAVMTTSGGSFAS